MGRGSGRSAAKAAQADGSACTNCGTPFTLFNWKHQCRRCLRPFCDNCSKDRVVLTNSPHGKEPQRVCHACKVAERRFRLEGQGKRGPKRSSVSQDGVPGQAEDLGLGADPLGGDTLGQPLTQADLKDPDVAATLQDLWFGGEGAKDGTSKSAAQGSKSKGPPAVLPPGAVSGEGTRSPQEAVQAEKKRAVALRKAGKDKEAMQALRHAHELEAHEAAGGSKSKGAGPARRRGSMFDVSEEDMADPDLLAQLQDLGWAEEAKGGRAQKKARPAAAQEATAGEGAAGGAGGGARSAARHAEVKGEILAHKKRGLQLRKAGQLEAWREEMSLVQALQAELEQQGPPPPNAASPESALSSSRAPVQATTRGPSSMRGREEGSSEEEGDPAMHAVLRQLGFPEERPAAGAGPEGKEALEREIAQRKSAAIALKREGNVGGAKAVLLEVKQLERRLQQEDGAARRQPGPASRQGQAPQRRSAAALSEGAEHAVEVTSEDEHDPEMAAALRDMGWQEEITAASPAPTAEAQVRESAEQLVGVVEDIAARTAALQQSVVAHKKAALAKKRAGDVEGAKQELRQSKALEAQLAAAQEVETAGQGGMGSRERPRQALHAADLACIRAQAAGADDGPAMAVDSDDEHDPEILAALRELGWAEDSPSKGAPERGPAAVGAAMDGLAEAAQGVVEQRAAAQQRVVALKKQALALRKQGDLQGAKAALAQAKQLEAQLERGHEQEQAAAGASGRRVNLAQVAALLESQEGEVEVTAEDESDPDILAALQDMGWREEAKAPPLPPPAARAASAVSVSPVRRTAEALRAEAQRLKREALELRRAGKMAEWRASVQQAQALEGEAEQAQAGASSASAQAAGARGEFASNRGHAGPLGEGEEDDVEVTSEDESDPALQAALQAMGWQDEGPPAGTRPGTRQAAGGGTNQLHPQDPRSARLPTRCNGPEPLDSLSVVGPRLMYNAAAPAGNAQGLEQAKQAAGATAMSASSTSGGRDKLDTPGLLDGAHPPAMAASTTRPPAYWPDSPTSVAVPPAPLPAASSTARPSPHATVARSEGAASGSAVSSDRVSGLRERIRASKQEAVRYKQQGRLEEARAALLHAKGLERELEATQATTAGLPVGGPRISTGSDSGPAARKRAPLAVDKHVVVENDGVEDAFDPDMVAALKGLGWTEEQIRGGMSRNQSKVASEQDRTSAAVRNLGRQKAYSSERAPQGTGRQGGGQEQRANLEEQVKQKKRSVIELKRAGRQQEALALFKEVKVLEKQLC